VNVPAYGVTTLTGTPPVGQDAGEAGGPEDGGASGSVPSADGSVPGVDAGGAPDGGRTQSNTASSSGCGCRVTGRAPVSPGALLLLIGLVPLARRRR
jgi:MYXO-CTERM domain-containing protein